jgi:hypothetical protein
MIKIQKTYIKYFLIFKLVVSENINSIFIYNIVTNIYAHKRVDNLIHKNQFIHHKNQFIHHKNIILSIKPGHYHVLYNKQMTIHAVTFLRSVT